MRYIVQITDVLNWNGITCSAADTNIVFEQPGCGDIVCIKADNLITIEIPDGCTQQCFYGIVSCDSDCDDCGDREIKICPCVNNSDCDSCSTCDPTNHVCVNKCPKGEICSESCGGCAQCDENNPCTNGRTCQNCKCDCPTDKPYLNSNNVCINCRTNDDCPLGQRCTEDGCLPVDCETGVYDKETDKCVQCITRANCEKPNECCTDDNKCECCPGFVRDADGNCVTIDCKFDSDCKDCEYCDIAGGSKCKPIVCPPGTICSGGGCVDICDCDDPLCNSNNACIRINGDTCGCSKCEGNCANGEPCGPNCYCDKSGTTPTCRPNPCAGSCTNGTDCGPGCGCNKDTDQCEPCNGVDCGEGCNKLLGCGCTDGENCVKILDCGNECSVAEDCADDCGCHQGKCVNCKNFPCDECGSVAGCGCSDGINCGSVPKDCTDVLTILKNEDNCSITGVLDVKGLCACPILTSGVIPTTLTQNLSKLRGAFRVELRKGNVTSIGLFNNAPLLNDLTVNALNDLPLGGLIEIKTIATYDEYNWDLEAYQLKKETVHTESKSVGNVTLVDFTGIDIANINFGTRNPYGIKVKTLGEYKPTILRHVEVIFTLKSTLDFKSGCGYDPQRLFKLSSDVTVTNDVYQVDWVLNNVAKIVNLLSDDQRKPLIIWSKNKNASHTQNTIFRKVYADKDLDGKYRDTLYGPGASPIGLEAWPLNSPEGELWAGYDYELSSDCSCDTASIDDLVFCKPQIDYELDSCNKLFKVVSNFTPCPINKDLTQYDPNGILGNKALVTDYDIPLNAQVKYEILFNNVLKHTFVGSLSAGFELLNDEAITSVIIRQKIDGVIYCVNQYNHPINIPTPPYVISCSGNGMYYSVDITKVFSESGETFSVSTVFGPAITVTTVGNTITVGNLVKGGNTTLVITYGSGCTKNLVVADNCCQYTTLNVTSDQSICSTGPATLTAIASGFSGTLTYSWNGGAFGSSSTFVANTAGTYNVVARDGICPDKSASILVTSVGGGLNFNLVPTTICSNGSAKLNLSGDPGAIYTINGPGGSIITGVIPDSGTVPEVTVTEGGRYYLNNYSSGPCTFNPGLTFNLTKLTNPTATLTYPNSIVCAGTPILLSLTGTPNAVVSLSSTGILASSSVTLNTSGLGSTTVTFNNTGTSTVTINSVTLGTGLTACTHAPATVYTLTSLIVASPVIMSAVAVCNQEDPYSDYYIEVVATQGSAVTCILGPISLETPHSPGYSTYRLESVAPIPGSSLLITATSALSGSCTATLSIPVPSCDCPTINITAIGANACPGDSGTLTSMPVSGPGTYTYQWYNATTGIAIPGATTSTYTTSVVGSYYLRVNQVGTTCYQESANVALTNTVDPNPAIVLVGPSIHYIGLEYTFNVSLTPGVLVTGFTSSDMTIVSQTSTQVVVSAASSGTKSFTVTYTFGGCTFTKVQTVIISNCYPLTVSISGSNTEGCGVLYCTATGGTSPYTYQWTGTGDQGTVVNVTGNTFNGALYLFQEENITLSIVATDANGCFGSTNVVYNRCDNFCGGGSCEEIYSAGVNSSIGTNVTAVSYPGKFKAGRQFNWAVSAIGTSNSVKAVLKLDGVIIFDTGWITRSSTACGLTLCEPGVELLGDSPASTVTLTGGTLETGVTAPLIVGGCDRLNYLSGPSPSCSGFIYGSGANVITLPSDGVLTMEFTRGTCTGPGSSLVASFVIEAI
ncbi:MAG: hypothetical protein WAT79_08930 [Saprospiraceae bacterium]